MIDKHTPGPWHVEPLRGWPSIRTSSGSVIASMDVEDANPITRAADGANARLIAAAPELLEALEDALYPLDYGGSFDEWETRARAAIKAAKGDA